MPNLYEDPFTKTIPTKGQTIKLLRPFEICENIPGSVVHKPKFIVKGADRYDVNQGGLGNCWFMAGLQSVTMNKKLMKIVLNPKKNSFKEDRYDGKFIFRFFNCGSWEEVIIDDLIPCVKKGHNGNWQPCYADLSILSGSDIGKINKYDPNVEFWPLLIEKAYAKFCGGYEKLEGGFQHEALAHLAGAVGYEISNFPKNEFNDFTGCNEVEKIEVYNEIEDKILDGGFLFACRMLDSTRNGIHGLHAYSIIDAFTTFDKAYRLICIKNPWGQGEGRNLDFNDTSCFWKDYPKEKKYLKQKVRNDGEFWMRLDDFLTIFDSLYCTYLTKNCVDKKSILTPKMGHLKRCSWRKYFSSKFVVSERGKNGKYQLNSKVMFDVDEKKGADFLLSLQLKDARKNKLEANNLKIDIFTVKDGPRQPDKKELSLSRRKVGNDIIDKIYKDSDLKPVCPENSGENQKFTSKFKISTKNPFMAVRRVRLPRGRYVVKVYSTKASITYHGAYFSAWKNDF